MLRMALVTFFIGLFLSSAASAATVEVETVQGHLLIKSGDGGFRPVTATTEANAGAQVMASPGGHGRIVYSNGCVVNVYPGAVVTVKEGSCKLMRPMMLACDPKDLNCPAAVPGTPWWVWAGAAVLVGGAICAGACEGEERKIVTTATVSASVHE
jgi:hypothetical protein